MIKKNAIGDSGSEDPTLELVEEKRAIHARLKKGRNLLRLTERKNAWVKERSERLLVQFRLGKQDHRMVYSIKKKKKKGGEEKRERYTKSRKAARVC